jgi:carbamoyl-phosphate synthase large subunit
VTELEFQKELRQQKVYLHFHDGTSFKGFINKTKFEPIWGEAAFTTGMSGYQETMTDPSFLGQHIIFTTAHVGNYESNEKVNQSEKVHATSLIARNFSANAFLLKTHTPLISGVDTRSLVRYLTSNTKNHLFVITSSEAAPPASEFTEDKLHCNELALVSQAKAEVWREGANPIVALNYGIKKEIVKELFALGYPLVTLPYNTSAEEVLKYQPRLIFLSNGPGDPRLYLDQIKVVKELFASQIPIRGICLGHQLISLALGAEVTKLPFGQRGINHPLLDHQSGKVVISSQNHGYATHEASFSDLRQSNILKRELFVSFRSLFDQSIEGLSSTDHYIKSVQFHPEASPGPLDAKNFFAEIKLYLEGKPAPIDSAKLFPLPDLSKKLSERIIPYKKILLIGSGPIKIGQASEFDYSGTQACKSLKELGLDVVLLNSNPATIMTDPEMSYRTYLEPITKETVKKIIEKEKVDAVLSTMGGQTALNLCVDLEEEGYLKEQNVFLLGANARTIKLTEDRDLFAKECEKLGYKAGKRFKGDDRESIFKLASSIVGYPLIIRRDFALGGKGAALVWNDHDLTEVLDSDIKYPVTLEKSLVGYKEVELEVMVDCEQNGVIICSIENVDPCGIHTGDSITVAPAQTISDVCLQKMRTMSLTLAKHMGVVAGGANVQFAINPKDETDIVIIEMNPRVSRSSALASKATGYPIAKISALLAVGFTLKEILNDITKVSPVAFEPTLDYVAIKIPIFPFNKFPTSSRNLGPQMRSVGEVLALGSSFNESFMKALRSLELGLEIPSLTQLKTMPLETTKEAIHERLKQREELSLLTLWEGFRHGFTAKQMSEMTSITPWFIDQIEQLYQAEIELQQSPQKIEEKETLKFYKQLGMSDKYLAYLTNKAQKDIFHYRVLHKLFPVYKAVDTCSGEFKALTPYFYSTYQEENEAQSLSLQHSSYAIMGSGPNRIGQGIEFDYSCVKSCKHLKDLGHKAIMINSNPETVSTDYDSSDRLYLSALYSEDIYDILLNENPKGIITSFSGQTGIRVREYIEKGFRFEHQAFNFLGSSLETLDRTEDRALFNEVTKKTKLSHTNSFEVKGYKKFMNALLELGMPVIIRPSYVIGGESMYIFHSHDDINNLPEELKDQLKHSKTTFQIENYLENAIEYDVDLVRDHKGNTVFTVCEHIEHAGVHSGDSGMITPPALLTHSQYKRLLEISKELADELKVIGPINFQYAICQDKIYCIEANPRGSRTLPFLSKAYQISLPSIATEAMLGLDIENFAKETSPYFCVKQSTFPFDRYLQDNIILGPKMRSTGETMGIDRDKEASLLKSYLGNYPKLKNTGKILLSLSDRHKHIILPYLKTFKNAGYEFVGTEGTANYIQKQGIPCKVVGKITRDQRELIDALKDEKLVMVFNTPENQGRSKSDGEYIRNTAISFGVPCFTRAENIRSVCDSLMGTFHTELEPIALQEMILK